MKRSILLAIVGLTISAAPSFGAGTILLDNYNTSGPYVTYSLGPGLGAEFTAGLYYALGDVTGSIVADPSGMAEPGSLGPLTLGTGPGSTAQFYTSTLIPGTFFTSTAFSVFGTADAGGDTITLMIVAYNGPSYDTSTYRGHSAAFTMVTSAPSSPFPARVGSFMPGFNVVVPEPTTLALGGLGLAALLLAGRGRRQESRLVTSAPTEDGRGRRQESSAAD